MNSFVPLVQVHRGTRLESVHWGAYVLLEGDTVRESGGDLDQVVFYRSASKALQAVVSVTSGAADRFGWGTEALALAAGSHSATPAHIAGVRRMLAQAGVDEGALCCGAHWPFDPDAAQQARTRFPAPLRVFSNCSGKHAAMLAAAKALGHPLDTYLDKDHPVQQQIHAHIAACAGIPPADVDVWIDGCGAPTFALPLLAAARSMQRLAHPADTPGVLGQALARVAAAIQAHPDLIGGPGRFDTVLMQQTRAPLLAKAGAEGVHATVLPERDAVLFVKVADGSDRGYRRFVLDTLVRNRYVTPAEAERIGAAACPAILTNHAGQEVGRVEGVAAR